MAFFPLSLLDTGAQMRLGTIFKAYQWKTAKSFASRRSQQQVHYNAPKFGLVSGKRLADDYISVIAMTRDAKRNSDRDSLLARTCSSGSLDKEQRWARGLSVPCP